MKKIIYLFLLPCLLTFAEPAKESPCRVFFSTNQQLVDDFIGFIEKESKSIKLAAYSITNRHIARALVDAKKRGVEIEVVLDSNSIGPKVALKELEKQGVPLFVYAPEVKTNPEKKLSKTRRVSHMDHKFCIFGNQDDKPKVWTGSFNFAYKTSHSKRQNVLVFTEDDIVNQYVDEFENIRKNCSLQLKEYKKLVKSNG